ARFKRGKPLSAGRIERQSRHGKLTIMPENSRHEPILDFCRFMPRFSRRSAGRDQQGAHSPGLCPIPLFSRLHADWDTIMVAIGAPAAVLSALVIGHWSLVIGHWHGPA